MRLRVVVEEILVPTDFLLLPFQLQSLQVQLPLPHPNPRLAQYWTSTYVHVYKNKIRFLKCVQKRLQRYFLGDKATFLLEESANFYMFTSSLSTLSQNIDQWYTNLYVQ